MNTRIVKLENMEGRAWFCPQHNDGSGWIEFIGFGTDRYLCPKIFQSIEAAEEFLKNPSIYPLGKAGGFKVTEINPPFSQP